MQLRDKFGYDGGCDMLANDALSWAPRIIREPFIMPGFLDLSGW